MLGSLMGKRTPKNKNNNNIDASPTETEAPTAVDSHLFLQATSHVVPLENRKQRITTAQSQDHRRKKASATVKKVEFNVISEAEFVEGAVVGLDHAMLRQLKSGDMPIDKTLDLHGFTEAEAHRQLISVLQSAYRNAQRCVLVITGKGIHSGIDTIGILKESLPLWCQQTPLNSKILAFVSARPKHGGSGAFYIFLRRNKTS